MRKGTEIMGKLGISLLSIQLFDGCHVISKMKLTSENSLLDNNRSFFRL